MLGPGKISEQDTARSGVHTCDQLTYLAYTSGSFSVKEAKVITDKMNRKAKKKGAHPER